MHRFAVLLVLLSGCLTADSGSVGPEPDYLICSGCVFRQVFQSGEFFRSGWVCVDYASGGLTKPELGTGYDLAWGEPTPLHPLDPFPTVPILPPRVGDVRDCREIPPGLHVDVAVDLQVNAVRAVALELTNAPGSAFVWCASQDPGAECELWDVAVAAGKVRCGYNDGRAMLTPNQCVGWFPRLNWVLVDATSPPPASSDGLYTATN